MALRATVSQHVYFDESFGSLTCFLDCLEGDCLQTYVNPSDWVNDNNYVPSYNSENFRIIELFLNASGASSSELRVALPTWSYNGLPCAAQPDYFEPLLIDNNSRAQLKVKGNVGKLSHNQNVMIKCNARVGTEESLVATKVEAQYPIQLRQQTKDTYRCTIAAANAKSNYTIGADGSPVPLRCIVYDWQGNTVTDPGLSYVWTKMATQGNAIVWEPIGEDSPNISVGPDVVDNQATIKVDVYLNGTLICNDHQTVYDNHDPVQIVLTFDPADCTVRKDGDTVNVIKVYADCRRSDGSRCSSAKLTFVLLDTVGNEVQDIEGRRWQNVEWVSDEHPASGKINYDSVAFTITKDDFTNGGKELIIHVEGDLEY